jgi:hypothetical protein
MDKTFLVDAVRRKYDLLRPIMNERMRRQWAASEALSLARGGITLVAQATALSRNTIEAGICELQTQVDLPLEEVHPERVRRPGGGRHPLLRNDPTLIEDLEALVEPATRGDPQSPLRWTSKSTRKLADELNAQGHKVSHVSVADLLHDMDYSLQANRKTREGKGHPDRDAQFRYIAKQVRAFQKEEQPVISVDSKKRELIGNFKNPGREWQPGGKPEQVKVHDYPDQQLGKVTPGGVYDLTLNEGWVSGGNRSQHSAVRGRDYPPLVGSDGLEGLPRRQEVVDHGGLGREQCPTLSVVEGIAPRVDREVAIGNLGLPLSSWYQQMEQD